MALKHYRSLSILIGLVMLTAGTGTAQQRNVMTLRFDTLKLSPGQNDVYVNAYYTLSTPKPHNVRGYEARFSYDSTAMRIVEFITDGTASANLGFIITNPAPPKPAVIADGQQEIDTSNHVLFRFRANISSFLLGDTTRLHWDSILTRLPPYDEIDTLILQDGWITVQQPKVDLSLSSSQLDVESDSTITISVLASSLSNANLAKGRFGFVFDSSALEFLGARSGTDTISGYRVLSGDTVSIDVAPSFGSTALLGGKDFVLLDFKARHRTDTVVTSLSHGSFAALNSDAHLGNVTIMLGSVRVLGKAAKPMSVPMEEQFALRIVPNPAKDWVRIESSSVGKVEIVAMNGTVCFEGTTNSLWHPVASGSYRVSVSYPDGRQESRLLIVSQ